MTTNASSIRVVAEEAESDDAVAPATAAAFAPPAPVATADPRVDAAVKTIQALDRILGAVIQRVAAVEGVMQDVPQAASRVSALIRALGARVLALLGLVGCLGLAFTVALNPGWQTLVILGIVVFGLQLPLVLVAYLKGA